MTTQANQRPFAGRRDFDMDFVRSIEASVRGESGEGAGCGPDYVNATPYVVTKDTANNYDAYLAVDASAQAITVELPPASQAFYGTRIRAAKIDTTANAVTFSTSYAGGDSTPIGSVGGATTLANAAAGTSKCVVLTNVNGQAVWIVE